MSKKSVGYGVEVDHDTDSALKVWAEEEGRTSKRRQAAVLLRKLAVLRRTNPLELKKLRLIDPLMAN